jgi:NAD(P)-dependent dehydrogenase (short-subunit alcohol dehydrogenase family)
LKGDVSNASDTAILDQSVLAQFPALDTLINNAGIMRNLKLNQSRDLTDVTREIEINLSGPVRMIQQFLPHLKTRKDALIINVSSGLAFHTSNNFAGLLRNEGRDSFLYAIPVCAARRHGCYGGRIGAAGRRDAAVPRRVRGGNERAERDGREGAGEGKQLPGLKRASWKSALVSAMC